MAVGRETDWQLSVYASVRSFLQARADHRLVIIPVIDVPLDRAPAGQEPAVVAYGPPEMIRRAFLFSCKDYLRDPWTSVELILRGNAVLYRDVLELPWGRATFDSNSLVVDGKNEPLRQTEYEILRVFARSRDGVVSRDALRAVCGASDETSRSVDVHVSRIRQKLRSLFPQAEGAIISSVRGFGYRLQLKSKIRA